MNDKVKYWTNIAEYDLSAAKALLKTKHFLYVGFMCHQTIEKILKAMFVLKFPNESPPYTHALLRLSKITSLLEKMSEEHRELIRSLEPLNIESRYPRTKEAIISTLSKERCNFIIHQTEGLFKWIKEQL